MNRKQLHSVYYMSQLILFSLGAILLGIYFLMSLVGINEGYYMDTMEEKVHPIGIFTGILLIILLTTHPIPEPTSRE